MESHSTKWHNTINQTARIFSRNAGFTFSPGFIIFQRYLKLGCYDKEWGLSGQVIEDGQDFGE